MKRTSYCWGVSLGLIVAIAAAQELGPRLTERIDGIEGAMAGEPLLLAMNSRIQLAGMIGTRDPKRTVRLAAETISLAASLKQPRERAMIVTQAVTAMAVADLDQAAEVADTMPIANPGDGDYFPRERAYDELFRLRSLDRTSQLALTRRALEGGACTLPAVPAYIARLRKEAPDEATVLSAALLSCLMRHPVSTRFVNDALLFVRQSGVSAPEPMAVPFEALMESLADRVDAREWGADSVETVSAAFAGGDGKTLDVKSEPQLLRLQIAVLARRRFPALYEKLKSRPTYGAVLAGIDSAGETAQPRAVTYTLRNPVPEVRTEGMAEAVAEFRSLDPGSQLAFARNQRSPEIRAALLTAYLTAQGRTPDDQRRLIPELLGELEKTRPGYTRVRRGAALVAMSAALGDEGLAGAAGAGLARAAKEYCRCETEGCTTFENRGDCLGVYEMATKAVAGVRAAREAAEKEDVSLRVRLALGDLGKELGGAK